MSKISGDKNPKYKHGYAMKRPKWYNTWQNMKARCLRKSHPKYDRYGGRGIGICNEWLTCEGFASWANQFDWEGMSIDRIDNDGDYCPENCRVVSMSENSRKKSTTKLTFNQAQMIRLRASNGECEYDLADEYGVRHGTVWFIVNNFTHVADGECIKRIKENRASKP